MVNNGIVAVMVVGVGGMVSGETAASGDTQFYPKVTVDAKEKKRGCQTLPFFCRLAATSSSNISLWQLTSAGIEMVLGHWLQPTFFFGQTTKGI